MNNNKKYIKTKFKLMHSGLKVPTMYAELHNGKYTKTFPDDNNNIISEYISKDEYAAALAHILLRENGIQYLINKP